MRELNRNSASGHPRNSDELEGSNTRANAGYENVTPVPGLRLEVVAEIQSTPVAIYEAITDRFGRPRTAIRVDSASELVIQSLDPVLARFGASGAASEFTAPEQILVVVTPMVGQSTPCVFTDSGIPHVRFNYTNSNSDDVEVKVGITALREDLRGTPDSIEDDLHLNSLVDSNAEYALPGESYRAPAPDSDEQLLSGRTSFSIPFDPKLGQLTWTLLGESVQVGQFTEQCAETGEHGCQPAHSGASADILRYAQVTTSAFLKMAVRQSRKQKGFKGAKAYLNAAAVFYRDTKRVVHMLEGSIQCATHTIPMAYACSTAWDLHRTLTEQFDRLFVGREWSNDKRFLKLNRSLKPRYQKIIANAVPHNSWVCRSRSP